MRFLRLLLLILVFTTQLSAQMKVGFESTNQEIVLEDELQELFIDLKFENLEDYSSVENVNITITSDLEDGDYSIEGITKSNGRHFIYVPSELEKSQRIKLMLNTKTLKNRNYITLFLEKKGVNTNFTIQNSSYTVILGKREETKNSKISISKFEKSPIDIDMANAEKIEIPFLITSKGYVPTQKDSLRVKVGIVDFENFSEEITIVGAQAKSKLIAKKEDNPEAFVQLLESIEENIQINLQLENLNHKSKAKIEIDDKNNQLGIIVKQEIKSPNKYNFFIGTNFDLQEKLEVNSYYAEIDAWLPELIGDDFGIRTGLYKNNNSTSLEEETRQKGVTRIVEVTEDSISYEQARVESFPNVEIENLGLYVEALIKLVKRKSFTMHAALHFEVIQRTEKYAFNSNDIFAFGISTISLDSLKKNDKLQAVLSQPNNFTRKYFDSYYGIGVPMRYTSSINKFEIFINPIVGFGSPGLVKVTPEGPSEGNKYFGVCQFSLIETRYGIKLSGEIRKYFNYLQDPIVSINLSKSINLESLFESGSN